MKEKENKKYERNCDYDVKLNEHCLIVLIHHWYREIMNVVIMQQDIN